MSEPLLRRLHSRRDLIAGLSPGIGLRPSLGHTLSSTSLSDPDRPMGLCLSLSATLPFALSLPPSTAASFPLQGLSPATPMALFA